MTVARVGLEDREIVLIGTAHVSGESVRLVRETIEKEKPEIIAVELCEQRYHALVEGRRWEETEITDVIKSSRTYLFMIQILLTNFQRKIGDEIGVKPGSEMLAAIDIAKKEGIKVALVDRDVKVTLKRALGIMSIKEKLKLFYGLFLGIFEREEIDEELIEKLKRKDIISELMEELSREIPSVKKVLVDERDLYIADRLLSLEEKKIVAVVGAGHIDGISRSLQQSRKVKNELKELETVRESKSRLRYLGYLIPMLFVIIIALGFYSHGADVTIDMLVKWFLINGTLSAIGVALAFGHPLSILSAFVAAPFTSLNPTIAAGWVAGLVELKMRKPRVMDFKGLLKLNDVRDYWKNRITRVILVIVFANIGSSIGTFVALPYLASLI